MPLTLIPGLQPQSLPVVQITFPKTHLGDLLAVLTEARELEESEPQKPDLKVAK